MVKRIGIFVAVVLALFAIGYSVHSNIFSQDPEFPLLGTYIFHSVASIIVYILIELVAKQLPNQAGYAFLATVFVKMGVFVLIFKSILMDENPLPMSDRLGIVIPYFTFLLVEAIFCGRLLNNS